MGQLKWGGKTFYPQAPKPIKSDINELMKPLSEKVDKGNVWGSIIMNVPEETSVGPVSPTPTPSVTPTITPTASLTPTPTITPTSSLTPTPTPSPSPFVYDSDAEAYLNAVVASGGTIDATTSAATNTLFTSLKSNNLYNKIYKMYPLISDVAAAIGIEAKNPTSGTTWYGGWTYSLSGATPNGTNAYGDLGWLMNAVIPEGLEDSHMGVYLKDGGQTSEVDFGARQSPFSNAETMTIEGRSGGGNCVYRNYNGNDGCIIFSAVTSADGYSLGTKRGDTDRQLYRNGVSIGTSSFGEDQQAPGYNAYIGAINNGGTPGLWSKHRLQFVNIGSGLTNSEVTTLTNIINTFQTSLSRNTY